MTGVWKEQKNTDTIYYPIQLNPFKKMAASFFDSLFNRIYMKKVSVEQFQSA